MECLEGANADQGTRYGRHRYAEAMIIRSRASIMRCSSVRGHMSPATFSTICRVATSFKPSPRSNPSRRRIMCWIAAHSCVAYCWSGSGMSMLTRSPSGSNAISTFAFIW